MAESIVTRVWRRTARAKLADSNRKADGCGYLAFAAMLMAGIDGVENRMDPGEPLDKDIYGMTPEELKDVPSVPGSLEEALDGLKKDHEFLMRGNVFTEDVISTWIEYKQENEVDPVRLRPVPYEFYLYYDN